MGQLKIPTFGLPETPFDSASYNEENFWQTSGVGGGNNQDKMYIDSGDISYPIIQVILNHSDFLDPTTALGMELEDLKYDVGDIE